MIDPLNTCQYIDEGWNYTPFITNPDKSPNSMTGPDGQRWYFLTMLEKEQRYGPIPDPAIVENDDEQNGQDQNSFTGDQDQND